MICNPQTLLNDAACFYGANLQILRIAQIALWCSISGNIRTDSILWQSENTGLWYITTFDTQDGVTTPSTDQTPVPAGTTPYLVFALDGLNYKVQLYEDSGIIDVYVNPTPVAEPGLVSKIVLDQFGAEKTMSLVDDGGPTLSIV